MGLHFALTDTKPEMIKTSQHPHIIQQAYCNQLRQSDIENELTRQIEKFERATGILPHFIDGHQHIHQLPTVRNALLSVYDRIFPDQSCYIRVPIMKPWSLKSTIIAFTGGFQLRKRLTKKNIPHNTSFSGVYNFKNAQQYPHYFRQFLQHIQTDGLIMCHPSLPENSPQHNDRIAVARAYEFNYFNSPEFLKDCESQSVIITRKLI